jgi:prepilin-type N-terminal cleavage/methylation domain-containing protein/prepilin-type processing-associated H-X9-DG protein
MRSVTQIRAWSGDIRCSAGATADLVGAGDRKGGVVMVGRLSAAKAWHSGSRNAGFRATRVHLVNNATSRRAGFSLIELLVVMGIIGLLVAIAVPAVTRSRQAARATQCQNNLHNLSLALTMFDESNRRLPASGNYGHDAAGRSHQFHNWAVSILPWVDQKPLADRWDLDKPTTDPVNQPLTQAYVPVYVCSSDISRSKKKTGDLSYAVNGGVGFTVHYSNGVRDCPVDRDWTVLDLNGNGIGCPADPTTDGDPSDRQYFERMGLFFLETWNTSITRRHHQLADIKDGLSQTFLITENVRTGYDPADPDVSFATSDPYHCAFYIGNPCRGGNCASGNVDYSVCNAGVNRINGGRASPEGRSPTPNSFHDGGVHMAYADGHVIFLSESIDGAVYAALASPQGLLLDGTPLRQDIVSGE